MRAYFISQRQTEKVGNNQKKARFVNMYRCVVMECQDIDPARIVANVHKRWHSKLTGVLTGQRSRDVSKLVGKKHGRWSENLCKHRCLPAQCIEIELAI